MLETACADGSRVPDLSRLARIDRRSCARAPRLRRYSISRPPTACSTPSGAYREASTRPSGRVRGVPALYIADGHHRAASAARARRATGRRNGGRASGTRFSAVAFPDDQMQILPYNRVVKDLGGAHAASLLRALAERFDVRPGRRRRHAGASRRCTWAGSGTRSSWARRRRRSRRDERLDVSRLQELILTPLLGIGDVRTDKRIDFVGGARGHRGAGAAAWRRAGPPWPSPCFRSASTT